METSFLLGAGLAIMASTFLNIGKGLQKWKVGVLGTGRKVWSAPHRVDFVIWMSGVALTTVATVLYSLALKFSDKPSTVSALNGVGLIGLVVFAWLVLREKMGRRELFGAALVVVGTTVMGAFDKPAAASTPAILNMLLVVAGLLAAYLPLGIYAWRARRFHGVVFGSLVGVVIGTSMVLGDLALLSANNDFIDQLKTPWVYVALVLGLGALGMTQVAFWRARAMVVVPTINSFIIFTPLLLQWVAFGTVLAPAQYLGVAIIVAGVVPLTTGETSLS